jgi:hypothetical protein
MPAEVYNLRSSSCFDEIADPRTDARKIGDWLIKGKEYFWAHGTLIVMNLRLTDDGYASIS